MGAQLYMSGLEGKYVIKNNKKMAYGYTTGSCSAAAAKAAAIVLFTGEKPGRVTLPTPKGILLELKVEVCEVKQDEAVCCVEKDAGDDPDVTDGVRVYARVRKGKKADQICVNIDGGVGVGRVTKPGLEQPVGAAAINRVPRQMITEAVTEICEENDFLGELFVEISIPAGTELAKKTFNPRLGIEGGISVLGTSGIVEPMSEEALIASIRLEMQMKRANGVKNLVVAPGNYGTAYLSTHLPVSMEQAVKCSNFVGETIDIAVEQGYEGILFVSHIGKFIKVAGGIMNTHSRNADARMELLAANALAAGAAVETVKKILESLTTDEGIRILKESGDLQNTMECVLKKIDYYLKKRAYDRLKIGVILFSNEYGELGKIGPVDILIDEMRGDHS